MGFGLGAIKPGIEHRTKYQSRICIALLKHQDGPLEWRKVVKLLLFLVQKRKVSENSEM